MDHQHSPILVVEDDQDDFYVLDRAFRSLSMKNKVIHVEDGELAINYLRGAFPFADRSAYSLPILVLLDLKLPMIQGFDVLEWKQQQQNLSRIPVIVFSSSSEQNDIERAYNLGATAYVVKPKCCDRLGDIVRSIGEFWLRHNTSPS